MTLRDYLQLLRQRIVLVLAIVLLATAATVGLTIGQRPHYQASAQLRVLPIGLESNLTQVLPNSGIQADLGTEAALVRSADVADRVITSLHLTATAQQLISTVAVQGVASSQAVLVVSATAARPGDAVALANGFAQAYLDVRKGQFQAAVNQATTDATKRLKDVQDRINADDAQLVAAAPTSPNYDVTKADRDAAVAQLEAIQTELQALADREVLANQFGQIILPASGAQAAHRKSVPREAVFGLLIGLPLALAVVLLLDTLRDAIRSKEEVEQHAGTGVLGIIPLDDTDDGDGHGQPATEADPFSPMAEAYRTLAFNLKRACQDGGAATVLFTSSASNEGKTTTAVNLAIAYAEAATPTVLLEADLRRPQAFELLQAAVTPGLADVLRGEADVAPALQRVRPNLSYLGPGLPTERADLLISRTDFRAFLSTVRSAALGAPTRPLRAGTRTRVKPQRDAVVLVDAPPILQAAEVSTIAASVDAVVLVARIGETSRRGLVRAAEQVRQVGGHLLGAVLVGARAADEPAAGPRRAYPLRRGRERSGRAV